MVTPDVNNIYIHSDMADVSLVLITLIACGTKHVVVRVAAMEPIMSGFII